MSPARRKGWLVVVAVVQAGLIAWVAFLLMRGNAQPAKPEPASLPKTVERVESQVKQEPAVTPPVVAPAPTPAPPDPPSVVLAPAQPTPVTHAVLTGRLAGKGTKQPRDATLSLFEGSAGTPTERSQVRPETGSYALPGLVPGSYRLQVNSAGFRDYSATFEIPAGVAEFRHDVILTPSWELRVQINHTDGTPVHERFAELAKLDQSLWRTSVSAVALFEAPPPLLPPTEMNESDLGIGRWRGSRDAAFGTGTALPKRFAGYLELPNDEPLYVSAVLRTAVLATERVEAGQEELILTVPLEQVLATMGTVRLQVVDAASGQPVAGARVGLSDAQSSGQGLPVDAQGKIELRFARPGLLNLDIQVKDRVAPLLNVEVAPGATIDLGAIAVHVPIEFKATLVDAPAEVQVSLVPLDQPAHPALKVRGTHFGSARNGEFTARIAPGRYRLRGTPPVRSTGSTAGGLAVVEFDTQSLTAEPLRVPMQATAKLKITPPANRRVQLAIRDAAGLPHFRRWLSWTTTFDLNLVPGEFTVEITPFGGTATSRPLHLPAAGAELDLR